MLGRMWVNYVKKANWVNCLQNNVGWGVPKRGLLSKLIYKTNLYSKQH